MSAARELHRTSPLPGLDLLAIRQRLRPLGYRRGPLDGVYGPSTFAAVEAFQRPPPQVDGVVGVKTRIVLASAHPITQPPGCRAWATRREASRRHREPSRFKLNPFGAWFGVNGVP
jgi:hypothetical protein